VSVRTIGRFYKTADVAEADGRYFIRLDGKPLKTPKQSVLALPTRALAEAIAEEWAQQGGKIDLDSMPLTRLANTAVELTDEHRPKAAEQILAFGKSDLLCYRAEEPADLIARQSLAWDPLLDWSAREIGAQLATGQGITFVDQSPAALAAFEKVVLTHDAWTLVPLHAATTITGSLVLALALLRGRLDAREAFDLSRIDETFQAEKWGLDVAAEVRENRLKSELEAVEMFLRLGRCLI
jgi:chaperone required for assembly of F1-ATPase